MVSLINSTLNCWKFIIVFLCIVVGCEKPSEIIPPRSDLGLGPFQGEWVEVATLEVPPVALSRNAFLEDKISDDLWWWVAGTLC